MQAETLGSISAMLAPASLADRHVAGMSVWRFWRPLHQVNEGKDFGGLKATPGQASWRPAAQPVRRKITSRGAQLSVPLGD